MNQDELRAVERTLYWPHRFCFSSVTVRNVAVLILALLYIAFA